MALYDVFQEEVFEQLPEGRFHDMQLEESIDLLDNLGYVAFNRNSDLQRPTVYEVRNGIQAFRSELKESVLFEHLPSGKLELSEYELDFLAHVSDIEGGFRLTDFNLNILKEDPLLVRILRYRLHILGLLQEINEHYDEEVSDTINALKPWLEVTTIPEVIQLLDNFNLLMDKASRKQWSKGFRNMIFFQFKEKHSIDYDLQWFEGYLWMLPQKDREYYLEEVLNKPWLTKKARTHIDSVISTPFNDFMIRLIQIKIWLIGSYDKKIDGDMGGFSVKALKDLHDMADNIREEGSEKMVEPKRYLIKLGKGYWALNYKYLMLHGLPRIEPDEVDIASGTKAISAQLNELVEKAENPNDRQMIIAAIEESVQEGLKEKKPRKKKKFRKAKGFMRHAINFFKKIGRWVSSRINDLVRAIKNFFKWVKTGVSYIIRELKEAFKKMAMALKFFFSSRIVKTGENNELVSDFDADFDVVNRISGNPDSSLYDEHHQKISVILHATGDTFEILKIGIPILIKLAAGPVAWIREGIRLVRLLLTSKFDLRFHPLLSFIS